jgi:hypothetical protein
LNILDRGGSSSSHISEHLRIAQLENSPVLTHCGNISYLSAAQLIIRRFKPLLSLVREEFSCVALIVVNLEAQLNEAS